MTGSRGQVNPSLDLSKLCDLVAYVKPEVAVLVNSKSVLQDGWGVIELDHSARLMFLESYRSHDGDVIFGLSGFRPAPSAELLAKAKKDKWLNALVCKRTSDIPPTPDGQIRIYEGERPDLWRVIRTADTVMLLPPGGLTVRGDRNYEIVKTDDGKYQLQIL